MTKDNELERHDLRVDGDIQISDDGRSLTAYLETWFNADKKFHEDLSADDTWLNLYATYDPFKDTVEMHYTVETDDFSSTNDYHPTENEERIVKELIRSKIREEYDQSPQEFCREFSDNDIQMGGQT